MLLLKTISRGALLLFLSCCVFLSYAPCQGKDAEIPAKDRHALRTIARIFVEKLRDANDVEPLLAEYMSPEAPECMLEIAGNDEDSARLELSSDDAVRFLVAIDNRYYYDAVLSQKRIVPEELSHRYVEAGERLLNDDVSKIDLINALGQAESVWRELKGVLHSRQSPNEKVIRPKFGIKRFDADDEFCSISRKYGEEYYLVDTKQGLQLLVFKVGKNFQVFSILPNILID